MITLSVDETLDPKHTYKGFVASSQRQDGVYSALDIKYQVPQPLPDDSALPRNRTVDELYSKYNLAFTCRSESRTSLHSSSSVLSMARSLPTSVAPIAGSPASSNSHVTRRASEFSDGSTTCVTKEDELSFKSRPVESMWSLNPLTRTFAYLSLSSACMAYDNVIEYPCMVPPVRTEKRLIDGVEQEVEIEVELPLKRLFLFPGKKVR